MRSSSRLGAFALALTLLAAFAAPAAAEPAAQGFSVERFYPSAPGGGWLAMDALDQRGGLGGAMALTGGYAAKSLRVTDGGQKLSVVSDQAIANFGFAATYDRFRLYLNFDMPLVTKGKSGTVGGSTFTGPNLDLGSHPDTLSDARVGFDARLFGGPKDALRLGASAQLLIPSGNRADYDTDATYRFMGRALVAGDAGSFAYAGHLGVHVRPLDDGPVPGSPQGSELLFGAAVGWRSPVRSPGAVLILGPEVFGATAFRSFLGSRTTALEAMLSARVEGTGDDGPQLRVKWGVGGGLDAAFGAPAWRAILAIEVFDHGSDRDRDGVSDRKDACPDTPGAGTNDPKTSGCPRPPTSP